ncbi:MAG: hypothetical protein ABEJ98_05515 [Candidatus Nanohaloarchaea archaeon]
MSHGCEECDKDFSSELEKLEHELEEHDEELSSHSESKKKKRRNKLQQKKQSDRAAKKQKIKYAAVGVFLVGLVAGGGFYASQNMDFSRTTNASIGLGEPVHWHADYNLRVCGESKTLRGGPLLAHTHGETRFHLEGVRTSRKQTRLDWIMDQLGGQFSNKGVLGYTEPESCPGSDEPGNLTVKVNGNVIETPEDYIVRDGDEIKITYS